MGAKLDPAREASVPSHKITVSKKKTPRKFDGQSMGRSNNMNQTQIVFSGKDTDLTQDEDRGLPTLVGSAHTTHRNIARNSQVEPLKSNTETEPTEMNQTGTISLIRNENQQHTLEIKSRSLLKADLN